MLDQWIFRSEDLYYGHQCLSWRNHVTPQWCMWGKEPSYPFGSYEFTLFEKDTFVVKQPLDLQLAQQLYNRDRTQITFLALRGHVAAQKLIAHMETAHT